MKIETRIKIEKKIAKACIDALFAAGYSVTINYGDEDEDGIVASTDRKAILELLFDLDEAYVFAVAPDGRKFGYIFFVFGNDGYDVICDYTVNLETVLAPALAVAEKMEEKYT